MTFEDFWKAYPRRKTNPRITAKRAARERAEKLVKEGEVDWETLVEGAQMYRHSDNVKAGYIKMPVTWLNQGCWDDEYEVDLAAVQRNTAREQARATPPELRTENQWRAVLGNTSPFNKQYLRGNWNPAVIGSPEPGPGCIVPPEVLREYGFLELVQGAA